MVVVTILVGLIVGLLVGMSGIGGAILLLPVMIIVLKVPPLIAIGSDAVFAALTKSGAAIVHWRQKTVDFRIVGYMAVGSLPGALAGFYLLTRLRALYGEAIGGVLQTIIGVLLLLVPMVMLAQTILVLRRSASPDTSSDTISQAKPLMLVSIGLLGGTLVGLTSVGSGSIILVLLLLVVRRKPSELVGTDIVHAVVLTGLTGVLHFTALSSVDFRLVGLLLLGSLPGAYAGARLSAHISPRKLRLVLIVLLVSAGVFLLT